MLFAPSSSLFVLAALAHSAAADDRTTEAGEAAITDPTEECTAYYYAPVAAVKGNFPTIWEPASILSNDTAAQDKWNEISSSIPTNITVKGLNETSALTGNFTGITYDYGTDPDCWWTNHQCTTPKLAGLPADVASIPEPMSMGYGFDDGPNCSHNAFYDFLEENNQKATMFFIGSNVLDWPLEAQRALTDGHEICVHTWSHRYMTAFPSEDAFAELWYTMQAIKAVTGVTPTCWRPPFGDVDDRIRSIANALGLQTIIWKYDSNDWKNGVGNVTAQTVDDDYNYFISNASSGTFDTEGGIMLTHELNNYTMQTAMDFYSDLKAAFSYIVPVGVALNKTQPYQETNYSLPTFEEYISGTISTNSSNTSSSSSNSSSESSPAVGMHAVLSGSSMVSWTLLAGVAMLVGLML